MDTLDILKKIIPEEMTIIIRRYNILKGISNNQPIGRRHLAQILKSTEKVIRNEIDFLKALDYISVNTSGMALSESGIQILNELEGIIHHIKGLSELERTVKDIINCEQVIIVPGDVDEDDSIKLDIGKASAEVLIKHLKEKDTVAIAGGSTAYQVVQAIKAVKKYEGVLVLPARGSLRNNVEFQANTIAAVLATKLGAKYELLHIPDNLSRKALESVLGEPEIQKTINKILTANIIIYGIGNANEMAKRRNLSETYVDFLNRKEAIAEVLGHYFNKNGEIVYTSRSIGIKLEQMTKLAYSIAVVGGKKKASAILAVRNYIKGCLILDEGAAKEIIQIVHT